MSDKLDTIADNKQNRAIPALNWKLDLNSIWTFTDNIENDITNISVASSMIEEMEYGIKELWLIRFLNGNRF